MLLEFSLTLKKIGFANLDKPSPFFHFYHTANHNQIITIGSQFDGEKKIKYRKFFFKKSVSQKKVPFFPVKTQ